MSGWTTVVLAGVLSLAVKLAGYVVPNRWFAHPRLARATGLMPVALLSALVAVQAFTSGGRLVIDARAAGVAVAFGALALRAPFLVVITLAAVAAALLRARGIG